MHYKAFVNPDHFYLPETTSCLYYLLCDKRIYIYSRGRGGRPRDKGRWSLEDGGDTIPCSDICSTIHKNEECLNAKDGASWLDLYPVDLDGR